MADPASNECGCEEKPSVHATRGPTEKRKISFRVFEIFFILVIIALLITAKIDRDSFRSEISRNQRDIEKILRHLEVCHTENASGTGNSEEFGVVEKRFLSRSTREAVGQLKRKNFEPPKDGNDYIESKKSSKITLSTKNFDILTQKVRKHDRQFKRMSSQVRRIQRKTDKQSDPQAVFIIPIAPIVDIRTKGLEHIGPWYLPQSGRYHGFSKKSWYSGLSLSDNRTSIIFSESGLFLIYSQVYYHITPGPNEKPGPMGYIIYLRRYGMPPADLPYRPAPIAECATSYPTTLYQTCFTQLARYFNAGDEIFLEHSTKSLPAIEADVHGKTFLGIVRLSGP